MYSVSVRGLYWSLARSILTVFFLFVPSPIRYCILFPIGLMLLDVVTVIRHGSRHAVYTAHIYTFFLYRLTCMMVIGWLLQGTRSSTTMKRIKPSCNPRRFSLHIEDSPLWRARCRGKPACCIHATSMATPKRCLLFTRRWLVVDIVYPD